MENQFFFDRDAIVEKMRYVSLCCVRWQVRLTKRESERDRQVGVEEDDNEKRGMKLPRKHTAQVHGKAVARAAPAFEVERLTRSHTTYTIRHHPLSLSLCTP